MYNNTIKVENKIISADLLADIFCKMNDKLTYYMKIYQQEFAQNQQVEFSNKVWTFKDAGTSKLHFQVDFYDNTNIKFDNYVNFISVYNSRLHEIKSIEVRFVLSYEVKQIGIPAKYYNEHINMRITEKKMDIDVALDSSDDKMEDIYKMIEEMVLTAPEKYDDTIKKKKKIENTVGFSIGSIPAIVIMLILLIFDPVRSIVSTTYVTFPIATILLSYMIGNIVSMNKLGKYYKNIMPDQVYGGYDSVNRQKIYKDDIKNYVGTSEILIGKNANNLNDRKSINLTYEKYKKWPLYEIGIIAILSIVVLFLK